MDQILENVNDYYTRKIKEFGVSPRGVDWNSEDSQVLRFDQLCKIIDNSAPCSLLDYGCGYGALLDHLKKLGRAGITYTGFDISEEMIAQAKKIHGASEAAWTTKVDESEVFDYTVASGIFNVRLETPVAEWEQYVLDTIHKMNKHSARGFAFNVLTSYSDKEYMKDYLYYANPGFLFDYCKKNFSKYVAVLHDYPLYEFTVLVRKF